MAAEVQTKLIRVRRGKKRSSHSTAPGKERELLTGHLACGRWALTSLGRPEGVFNVTKEFVSFPAFVAG